MGPIVLLGFQLASDHLQIHRSTLNVIVVSVTTQIAWLKVVRGVFLTFVPNGVIDASCFQRVSSARARAIRYVDLGDRQGLFSGENFSWSSSDTLTGRERASAVSPFELLLNANRLVTESSVYNCQKALFRGHLKHI